MKDQLEKILARVIGDVNSLAELFSSGVTTVIPQFLTVVCVAGLMFTMNVKLAVLAIIICQYSALLCSL